MARRWWLSLLGLLLPVVHAVAAPAGKEPPMPPLTGLLFNQDCTDFFYHHTLHPETDGGTLLDGYVDTLADAGVTVLLCNTNARETNYRSDVWQSFWHGYDPEGPDEQPFLAPIPAGERASYRRLVHSMWALDYQGVDYPARVIARCRRRAISPWLSLRMNDVHFNDRLDHPFHPAFWRDPRYHRGGSLPYFRRALDYAHLEVRSKYRALIDETLRRYDLDGLELDFMREPYLFREGEEVAGGRLLTEWLREVRAAVRETAARRGHPIRLGVRVPSHEPVARAWGLDAVAWAREGLVDLVVPTPRWSTLEYDLPMADWRTKLAGTGVTLAGGLEILHRTLPGGPARTVSPEQAAGAATAVLAGGADAVYLFNYFPSQAAGPGWDTAGYQRTLRAMASLPALLKLPRRHALTWRDILGPAEAYDPPLPATGAALTFDLPTGPAPAIGGTAALELSLLDDGGEVLAPKVKVNGLAAPDPVRLAGEDGVTVLRYELVPQAMANGVTHLAVTAADGQPLRVVGVEVRIAPGAEARSINR